MKKPETDWQARFKEIVQNNDDGVPHPGEALQSKRQKTDRNGGPKKRREYRVSLTVLDRETGERKVCTISEAKTWDWGNREKVRSIGPWHIYNFERLLAVLAQKAEAGCMEVELVEAPFYMGC